MAKESDNQGISNLKIENEKKVNNNRNVQKEFKIANIEWPYPQSDLYKVALNFFKDHEGKAFQPSYDQRNTLIAYTFQEKYGKFSQDKARPLGALDFVGHDRRNAWISLNDISSDEARFRFIQLVDSLCPFFRSFVIAFKCDLEEKQRKKQELLKDELQKQQEFENLQKLEEEKKQKEEKLKKYEQQKSLIQEMLNSQTISQFTNYAKQQYPNDTESQQHLIQKLQEQHFQQYIQQIMEQSGDFFSSQKEVGFPNLVINNKEKSSVTEKIQPISIENPNSCEENNISENNFSQNQTFDCDNEDEEESENEEEFDNSKSFSNASMWTRKDIIVFKESIQSEGGHGVIKVGHGEIATIRVPTHDDGSYIFWEFATDYYDIGFGMFFEWNTSPDSQVSVYFSESEDEDEEGHDVEQGTSRVLTASKKKRDENETSITVIIPIYRRDSHEEVFAGSHIYPGKGVYLLKFDNSYSLWRSKTLYYRVYYTKEP